MAEYPNWFCRRLFGICEDEDDAPSNEVMQSLIDRGANVNAQDEHGMTVLHFAIKNNYLNAVVLLLAVEGIDIYAKDGRGMTVFMYACGSSTIIEIVKALLAALKKTPNFDINDKDLKGRTALAYSCMKCHSHIETTKLLLSIPRINTQLKNNVGVTALHHAKLLSSTTEVALFQGELLPFQL
jgi:ankyrin repeat protein